MLLSFDGSMKCKFSLELRTVVLLAVSTYGGEFIHVYFWLPHFLTDTESSLPYLLPSLKEEGALVSSISTREYFKLLGGGQACCHPSSMLSTTVRSLVPIRNCFPVILKDRYQNPNGMLCLTDSTPHTTTGGRWSDVWGRQHGEKS